MIFRHPGSLDNCATPPANNLQPLCGRRLLILLKKLFDGEQSRPHLFGDGQTSCGLR
jgi:hypothetical protein